MPFKLAEKIKSGEYVDMPELLPNQLGASGDTKPQGPKKKVISSVLEWVQCFSISISEIALKEPPRTPDLLSYMNLIIEAHLKYSCDAWQGYGWCFRQRAGLSTKMQWATIDPTLWNLVFAGHANAKRCKHCFSFYHSHNSCNWAPEPATESFRCQPTPYSTFAHLQICDADRGCLPV